MKKRSTPKSRGKESESRSKVSEDMQQEYSFDYSKAKPNRFAGRISKERLVALLDPEVSEVFTTPESVNAALRALVTALPKSSGGNVTSVSMKVHVVPITKARLDTIPELERAFYLHIGHLRNEIMVIEKLLWWTQNNPSGNDVLATVNVSQSFIITRILAGKLWEGWELVRQAYFATKLSQSIEAGLPNNTQSALRQLKDYFGKKNIISMIRNQFAFHYSPELIRNQLADVEDTDKLQVYFTQKKVDTFYQVSEMVANTAMLQAVKKGDYEASIRKLMDEVLDVAEKFVDFSDGCLDYMMESYFLNSTSQLDSEEVEIS